MEKKIASARLIAIFTVGKIQLQFETKNEIQNHFCRCAIGSGFLTGPKMAEVLGSGIFSADGIEMIRQFLEIIKRGQVPAPIWYCGYAKLD
jgi:hypothetical protein